MGRSRGVCALYSVLFHCSQYFVVVVQYGRTALHDAAQWGRTTVAELLLQNSANPKIQDIVSERGQHLKYFHRALFAWLAQWQEATAVLSFTSMTSSVLGLWTVESSTLCWTDVVGWPHRQGGIKGSNVCLEGITVLKCPDCFANAVP